MTGFVILAMVKWILPSETFIFQLNNIRIISSRDNQVLDDFFLCLRLEIQPHFPLNFKHKTHLFICQTLRHQTVLLHLYYSSPGSAHHWAGNWTVNLTWLGRLGTEGNPHTSPVVCWSSSWENCCQNCCQNRAREIWNWKLWYFEHFLLQTLDFWTIYE